MSFQTVTYFRVVCDGCADRWVTLAGPTKVDAEQSARTNGWLCEPERQWCPACRHVVAPSITLTVTHLSGDTA